MPSSVMSDFDRLRSWSRHAEHRTPKSMDGVWASSYQTSYNGKKIGFNPDRTIVDYFSGNARLVPKRQLSRQDRLRSSFNDRARDGFRYWMIQPPLPSHFGKYGTGSYKTVLGIGNAPRT